MTALDRLLRAAVGDHRCHRFPVLLTERTTREHRIDGRRGVGVSGSAPASMP